MKQIRSSRFVVLGAAFLLLNTSVIARTIIVDNRHPGANDENPGTREAPFLSIQAAANLAEAGDTVRVRPGLYREAVVIPNTGEPGKPIVFQSEERHQAIVSGSDHLTDWQVVSPGIWQAETPDVSFIRHGNGEWVYVNGFPLERAEERERLLPGMFFQDFEHGRLLVAPEEGRDIRELKVEYAWRQGLFSSRVWHFHQQWDQDWPSDIHIIGFTLEHDGSWARGKSAIALLGHRWVIEDNHIRWVSTRAIGGRGGDIVLRNNRIEWAGQLAVGGAYVNLLMEGNEILYSNWRRFSPAWESGATKFVTTIDSVFRGNRFAYAFGPGWWSDGRTSSNLINDNVAHDNIGTGFFTEIDFFGQIFRDNISFNNNAGITVGETPGGLVRRNILFNNDLGIRTRGNYGRSSETGGREPPERTVELLRRLGLDERRLEQWIAQNIICWNAPAALMSNNTAFWENLIFDNEYNYFEHRNYAEPSPQDPFINNFSDYNIWYASRPDRNFRHERGTYASLDAWREASGRDRHSVELDPHDESAELPDWAAAHRALWRQRMRSPEELRELDLKLVNSPQAAVVLSRIRRADNIREVRMSDRDVRAFRFDHDGEELLALWGTQTFGRKYVRLNLGQDHVVLENAFQHREDVALAHQTIDLALTWNPVYLRGVGETVEEVESGILRVQSFNPPGAEIPVEAVFTNTDPSIQESLRLSFTASPGFVAVPERLVELVGPGERTVLRVTLKPDGSMLRGMGFARMEGQFGEETIGRVAAFVVGESAGVVPKVAEGDLAVDGSLEDWKERFADAPPIGVINTREQFNDGDLDRWGGPEDLSAWIYAAWSEDALYFAVRVVDDVVVPAPEGTAPWAYDAIEIFLDGRSSEMQWRVEPTLGCYQIGVSPAVGDVPANIQVFDKGRQLEGIETATALTEDGYVVEIRIPTTDNNFPAGEWASGRSIKLGVIVNDRDDPEARGRDFTFFWGQSPGRFFMDTSKWTTLTLE